jgi:hypothetical protein
VDRGTTRRRHIRACAIRYIGKEANEIDRQQMLGADSELDPEYGLNRESAAKFHRDQIELVHLIGLAGADKSLRLAKGSRASIMAAKPQSLPAIKKLAVADLSKALENARSAIARQNSEFTRLNCMIEQYGLRRVARRLSIDPSNLRRAISKYRIRLVRYQELNSS